MNTSNLLRRVLGRRWVQVLGLLVVLYAAAGFLLAPALIRAQLPKRLGPLLHREVTAARVRVNPFALSVTLDGFLVKDKDGSALLGWDRLYVNLGAESLFRLAPVFQEIRLEGFHAHVALDRDGNPTFQDLLAPSPEPAKPAGPLPDLRIHKLTVVRAQVVFADRSTTPAFTTTLGPLSLDLDAFRLKPDSNNPYAFTGRTERGETFGWRGHFFVGPLRSQGSFFVGGLNLPKYAPYYRDQMGVDVLSGSLDLKAEYELLWGEGRHALRLHRGEAGLDRLSLGEAGVPGSAVDLAEVRLRGLEADLLESKVHVASLAVRNGSLKVERNAAGAINLMRMATPRVPPKPKKAEPFTFDLDELRVENQAIAFRDLVPRRPVNLALDQLNLTVRNFSMDPEKRCDVDLGLRWNGRGRILATGSAAPLKSAGSLELKVDDLDLAPLDGYAAPEATLVAGRLGLAGHADFDVPASRHAFRGQAHVDGFKATAGNADVAWDALRVAGIRATSSPMALSTGAVDWERPAFRFVRTAEPAPAPPAGKAAQAPAAPVKAEIGAFRFKGGSFTFLDRTLQPVVALSLDHVDGQVGRLSSDPGSRASMELKALVDGAAPLTAKGTVNLLSQAAYTDLTLVMGGMDLSPLGPYAGRYVGYGIEKGKLQLDLKYLVQDRKLEGENRIRMDQFTLGEAVDSPEAMHVPVKLGLALLRDRHGLIDLDVPVRGDLASPDFRLGRVIWRAIINVFAKIATSPFALIGKAFGGGDADLSLLAFAPGADAVDPQGAKVLETLEKGLFERPGLRLEMEGTASEGDVPALKLAELEASLARLKGQPLAPGERPKFLRAAYLQAFPPPKDPKEAKAAPEPAAGDMEARLLARIDVDAAALRLLARRRVQGARDRLLASGRVPEDRVFIVDGGERARKEGGSRVYFQLK
ncbi:DUF748 domain-containing protein [Mesoterricola silvestris]|uniref:DUF748 domain-containing protein n=1 Tax=Mesoterricola silvestris TaxID=2927979 RepID=A0AA48GTQ4_9BACT|nr:DUF748 domain-containing protein [Mesoterricola silvestris]BDU73877.1 hypothetical protein METEAL_30510 [Mesoterricola silvestris]